MPAVAADDFIEAVRAVVRVDDAWVPSVQGSSLYIRPTMIATEAFLGVRPSNEYLFYVILSPVDAYYAEGFNPLKIWVERERVRAPSGGVGTAKTGANYVASLYAAERAKKLGYAQVLWLDGAEHKYLEEVGTMNLFVQIGDEIITPALGSSILRGVTRDSVLTLLRSWGLNAVERKLSLDEIREAGRAGTLREIFGTGTAAVISPVGSLGTEDGPIVVRDGSVGPIARRLYDTISGIQFGTEPDPHEWMVDV
jgi:branched-chain amino acid aminotransferase